MYDYDRSKVSAEEMTFEEAKEAKFQLEEEAEKWSKVLNAFPKGPMGLVTMTPEVRKVETEYNRAFAKVRNFNTWFIKKFKREWSDRANRRRSR